MVVFEGGKPKPSDYRRFRIKTVEGQNDVASLGEVLRRRYAGSWEMTQYPGGVAAVPAVDLRGSRLFPLMKVYRRLTEGEEEDLRTFFSMVTERLGKPAQVN